MRRYVRYARHGFSGHVIDGIWIIGGVGKGDFYGGCRIISVNFYAGCRFISASFYAGRRIIRVSVGGVCVGCHCRPICCLIT